MMDKQRAEGALQKGEGLVKETLGKATGDSKLKSEGKKDRVVGGAKNAVGGAKDAVRDAVAKARH